MQIWCGIDLGSRRHRVSIIDETGRQLDNFALESDKASVALLSQRLRRLSRQPRRDITVALEDRSGLLPAELARLGYRVVPIHPIAVARYRSSLAIGGAKSDRYDALVLANLVRLESELHRPLPHDSDLVTALRTLTRTHQEHVWKRVAVQSQVLDVLKLYYPGFIEAWPNLATPEARALFALAPTPAAARALRPATVAKVFRDIGRRRDVDALAAETCKALKRLHLRQPVLTEAAMQRQASTLMQALNDTLDRTTQLEEDVKNLYKQHPLWPIFTSFPGLTGVVGARILGEFGDDRERYRRPDALQALAGTRPITKQSGGMHVVQRRRRYNRRLGAAVDHWMLPIRNCAPEAKAYYQSRRDRGDRHGTAQRCLANKYLAILAACVRTDSQYDADKAAASLGRASSSR